MGSVNRRKIRTLLWRSTRAQNKRPKSKARALVLALGSAGGSVGVTEFQGGAVGVGVMDPISGLLITLKAASWPTLSILKTMRSCGVVLLQTQLAELTNLRSRPIRLPKIWSRNS